MSQSITETTMGLDIEAIEHLDFDPEVPCESSKVCDKTATWKFTMLCCGANRVMCDEHAAKERTFYLFYSTTMCDCTHCGGAGYPPDLVTWEKI